MKYLGAKSTNSRVPLTYYITHIRKRNKHYGELIGKVKEKLQA